jgi:hypothetical protein
MPARFRRFFPLLLLCGASACQRSAPRSSSSRDEEKDFVFPEIFLHSRLEAVRNK